MSLDTNAFPSTLVYQPSRGYVVLPAKPFGYQGIRIALPPLGSEIARDPRCTRPCCRPDRSLEAAFNWIDRVVGACYTETNRAA